MDTSTISIYLITIILLVSILYLFVFSSGYSVFPTIGDSMLIYGPMNSGKTLLYYKLKTNQAKQTVSSMRENASKFIAAPLKSMNSASKSYRFIDFPGHPSQKYKLTNCFSNLRA